MGTIVIVCASFDLTVSEAKTETMCLRAKGMLDSTTLFSVQASGQVNNQTNEFVYFGGNINHDAGLSIGIDGRILNAWCIFRKYTLELYDRPSAPLELKIRMPRTEVRYNAARLRYMKPTRVPLRHAAPSPPQVFDTLHRLAKA